MVGFLVRFVSCFALIGGALVASPSAAPAQQSQPTEVHYDTAIKSVYGSPYPLTGKLELQSFPGGHIRGYYHTTYDKLFIDVVGGRDGDYIWLDIGPSSIDLGLGAGPQGKLHVVATLNSDGSFKGQVYPETAAVLSGPSMAIQGAHPSPTSNDQYIFSATPIQVSGEPSVQGSAAPPVP